MIKTLLFFLIVVPFVSALCCSGIKNRMLRSALVLGTGAVLIISSLLLISQIPFAWSTETLFGIHVHEIVQAFDYLILFFILYLGFKHRSLLIQILAVFQIVLLSYLEFFMIRGKPAEPMIYCDNLSLIMVLIISIVGSVICFQAIAYMQNHEDHLHLGVTRQHIFFFVMFLFLGAMNGLVLCNDMAMVYFFFEITTLCSFLLIGHDRNETAVKNAVRALWMNSLAGAAFIAALVWLCAEGESMNMQELVQATPRVRFIMIPLALLCFAAFAKSAQFPFQSWLLGAMVAPTPVSALLHSSTMVKIGVYLVLRLAPVFRDTFLSQCVALCGSFAFLAGAALAVGQSNGKKVLAYSTISNLGLIFACAGLNTHAALSAAILLIIFHAINKGLLFLCVGSIEQHIESRDIEDMRGLYADMPLTALITVVGVITMILPPFGLILGKWMAMEAAAPNLFVIVMVSVGSALTVMYWGRWAGTLMSDPFAGKFKAEKQPMLTWGALLSLSGAMMLLSAAAPWLYKWLITPCLSNGIPASFYAHNGILENNAGRFAVIPLFVLVGLGFLISLWAVKKASHSR
ncbi:MAG: proton-conducting transporter membrane subunit, partial [Desulfobacterales bacterium]